MKSTGIVRRVDLLGRIVVPKEIRKVLRICEGDPLEIYAIKNSVVLKRYSPLSDNDGICEDISASLCRQTGKSVFICDKQYIISASGFTSSEIIGKPISYQLEKHIREGKTLLPTLYENQNLIPLTSDDYYQFTSQVILPIKGEIDVFGAIILTDKSQEEKITLKDIELTTFACDFLARRKE